MSDFESKISEDNLSAQLSGSSIHMLADALTSCFKGSGAINHLECSFEDPDDGEQYTLLMQKKSGITQGEKISNLQEENKQQRESLGAFRELVKAQTKTIHDLNEENTALQQENADLKDKTLKLTTTMYQLRDYLSDIEYDLDQADSRFTLKDEIDLIDEALTIDREE